MVNPFRFLGQVRNEMGKVSWPTRAETMSAVAMVLVMVVLASTFFFLADQVLSRLVSWALSL